MSKHPIAYYITAHGYGHGVRSCDILRKWAELYPKTPAIVVTDLPLDFLQNRLGPGNYIFRQAAFDVGMVQLDSIRVDLSATLRAATEMSKKRSTLTENERRWLKDQKIGAVVVDIPSIPLAAATLEKIPSLAVGNFGWDWIYDEFREQDSAWAPIVNQISEDYAKADLLLRLPFAEPMAAFSRQENIPLVASPGKNRRTEIAKNAAIDEKKTWALLSFSTLDWNQSALKNVERLRDYEFLTVKPLAWRGSNLHALDRRDFSYSDVLASVDVVITKPGFGVLSECVMNHKPIIYADRTDFREYAVLEASIKKYLKHAHIPSEQLYRGDLAESLEKILEATEPPQRLSGGGDVIAVQRIYDMVKKCS